MKTIIDIYPHYFSIKKPDQPIMVIILGVASDYTKFGQKYDYNLKKRVWYPEKTFALCIKNGEEFRFHIGQWQHFKEHFEKGIIREDRYDIRWHGASKAAALDKEIRSGWVLREDQVKGSEFILSTPEDSRRPLLSMPTGTGKTSTSLITAKQIGHRIAAVVLSRFSDKWRKDIEEIYDVKTSDICVIRGGDALLDASHWVSSGAVEKTPLPAFFVISIETLMVWIKKYMEDPRSRELQAYGCKLDDFFESLGIGTIIVDEVHMSMHQVYSVYCFLKTPWIINLSATVLSKDPTIQRIQKMMFPRYLRFEEIKMEKYITCHPCAYQIRDLGLCKVQTTERNDERYSHGAFERSIFATRILKESYVSMILGLIKSDYVDRYMNKDKLIVFVYQQSTAEYLRDRIRIAYPDYDTRTYLQWDPYENIIQADIIVTTIVSAGTALDIPNLRVAIQTISVASPVANIQNLGRLRKLKDRDVHFLYIYCTDIAKQVDFHNERLELFKPRTVEIIPRQLEALRSR